MLHQITDKIAFVSGYLGTDPLERRDKNGKRIVTLDVVYDRLHKRRPQGEPRSRLLHIPVVVTEEYTSYARTLQKGDCVLAVGYRPLQPPKGYTANPLIVSKYDCGFIGGTGITRAWTSEAEAYTKNQVARMNAKIKKSAKEDNDKFGEIRGDWY